MLRYNMIRYDMTQHWVLFCPSFIFLINFGYSFDVYISSDKIYMPIYLPFSDGSTNKIFK